MISDVYFPRVNGVSTSIRTFRRDLAEAGVETWLVAPEYPARWEDDERVLRQPSRYLPFDPEDRMMIGRAALAACRELAGRVDLVHVQTPFVAHRVGVAMARTLGVKVVETYHTYFEEYFFHYFPFAPRAWLRALARLITRRQCDMLDALIAPSEQMAAVLRDYGIAAPIEVVPTGLELEEFSGGDGGRFRALLGIGPDTPIMLLVSRVAHEKNIPFLLRVLASVRESVPDVLFVIAGEGPARGSLERAAQRIGVARHVRFVGYLDRRGALLDCYRAANVFVFASRTETQGLVLLEALALGVPVVSTAVLGTKEVLERARGALVVDEDVTSFARAVTDVLRAPHAQRKLGAEGRDYVAANWTSAEMARRMLRLYEKTVSAGVSDETSNSRHEARAHGEMLRGPYGR